METEKDKELFDEAKKVYFKGAIEVNIPGASEELLDHVKEKLKQKYFSFYHDKDIYVYSENNEYFYLIVDDKRNVDILEITTDIAVLIFEFSPDDFHKIASKTIPFEIKKSESKVIQFLDAIRLEAYKMKETFLFFMPPWKNYTIKVLKYEGDAYYFSTRNQKWINENTGAHGVGIKRFSKYFTPREQDCLVETLYFSDKQRWAFINTLSAIPLIIAYCIFQVITFLCFPFFYFYKKADLTKDHKEAIGTVLLAYLVSFLLLYIGYIFK